MAESAPPRSLASRYRPSHLQAFTHDELVRYADPELVARAQHDPAAWERLSESLAWELLYRIEPELYVRLVDGERIHPRVLDWLPSARRVVEVGAGAGRLTLQIASRCGELFAVEPAAPMRRMLERRLAGQSMRNVRVVEGFFDRLPFPDGSADLVVSCSAFTPDESHGGERGLREIERVCASGGLAVFVWPSDAAWFEYRGYEYLSFEGPMAVEFRDADEACELASIFYPDAAVDVCRERRSRIPYEVLGMNAPRDLAYRRMP